VFQEWEQFPGALSHFSVAGVFDEKHDRYTLQMIDNPRGLQKSRTLAYLTLRSNKIYIEFDGTEKGIAPELVTAGVPKEQIVLAFYPPEMREMGEFAVA
jgi:hypothetical protein